MDRENEVYYGNFGKINNNLDGLRSNSIENDYAISNVPNSSRINYKNKMSQSTI